MSNTILIGYDLNNAGQDYAMLIDKIKAHGPWWHHLDSTWLIKTPLTAAAVRDDLKTAMDGNNELLVIDVTGRARAWSGFKESGSNWLKNTY